MEIELTARRRPAALRPAAAWLLPGADPARWLEELGSWGVPAAELTLTALPRSGGLLAALPLDWAGDPPHPGPGCVPFGLEPGGLYLPVDAELEPELDAEELRVLLAGGQAVWHPALGLVLCAPGEELGVEDLLAEPALRPERWSAARPGVALAAGLGPLVPEEPPEDREEIDAWLEEPEARGDLASEFPDALDPLPGEPGPVARAAARLRGGVARAVLWLTAGVPATASRRTWVNRVEDWARERAEGHRSPDQRARARALERLLELLRRNVDLGLRFALPLTEGGGRGLGRPSNRLRERVVDFELHPAEHARPVDPWGVDGDLRRRLEQSYREAANRELRLGRHRRAAYVYAQLLGDDAAAATALEQGGYYREAAAVYRERLGNRLAAADCLTRGGLLEEAAQRYEACRAPDRAAELYERLGDAGRARAAWRRAVQLHLESREAIAAAKILEDRLDAPGEAFDCLLSAWLQGPPAEQCLFECFELQVRRGRAEEAGEWIEQLAAAPADRGRAPALAGALQLVATRGSDPGLARAAADAVRRVVGRALEVARPGEAGRLLTALRESAPHDRLLGRDARRFLRRRLEAARRPGPAPRAVGLEPEATTKLPRSVWWLRAAPRTGGPVFFGRGRAGRLHLAFGHWSGPVTSVLSARDYDVRRPLLTVHPSGRLLFGSLGGDAWELPPRAQDLRSTELLPWFPRDAVAAAYAGAVLHVVRPSDSGQPVLWSYDLRGKLLGSSVVPEVENWEVIEEEPFLLAEAAGVVVMAHGSELVCRSDSTEVFTEPRGATFRELAVATEGGRLVWAASCTDRLYADLREGDEGPLRASLDGGAARLAFCSGHLVACNERSLSLWQPGEGGALQRVQERPPSHAEPIAVLPADRGFTVCYRTGRLDHYPL